MKRKPFKIYVADDDEDDCLLIKHVFENLQPTCELSFFKDGDKLLMTLLTSKLDDLPSLILLDLNMPNMDGYEVLKTMRSHALLKQTPVLMLTGSNMEEAIRNCYSLGANSYMTKPSSYSKLTELLTTAHQYWFKTVSVPSMVRTF
ncbi:response regulator [Tellurirhabdus bombi]|uniref:response regulator n=1 Tax=Tellurirhabdus bombi TaxID=2907205 RepID=UPI001F384CD2|nr:response regulator [Tellurirhabdus bombi]